MRLFQSWSARSIPRRDAAWAGGSAACLLLVEVAGRAAPTAGMEVLCSLALVALAAQIALAHRRRRLIWLDWFTQSARRWGARWRRHVFQIGMDLREAPPLRPGLPPILTAPTVALLTAAVMLVCVTLLVGGDWWPALARGSYVLYLALRLLVWCAALFQAGCLCVVPPLMLRDLWICLGSAPQKGPPRRRVAIAPFLAGYFAVVVAAGLALPVWVASVLLGVAILLGTEGAWVPPRRRLSLLWRSAASGGIRSMQWTAYMALLNLLVMLSCLVVVLAAVGPQALGIDRTGGEGPTGLAWLGRAAAWLSACGWCAIQAPLAWLGFTTRRLDPATPAPATIHVSGACTRAERHAVRDVCTGHGWKVRFGPRPALRTDVRVELTAEPAAGGATGALRLTLAELGTDAGAHRIARRDEIQRRRILLRTLRGMLYRARGGSHRDGFGFWIAPQYWFITWMSRDTGTRGFSREGTVILDGFPPPYHRAFPQPVRQHLNAITRALQADLIFLEDGVNFRGLRRVLRMMFEQYDIHGGRRRIEEHHFTGVPHVRVVIHEFQLGRPWERGNYPEPDYEDLGRARILHIFRDRGEAEDPLETPENFDYTPAPHAGVLV